MSAVHLVLLLLLGGQVPGPGGLDFNFLVAKVPHAATLAPSGTAAPSVVAPSSGRPTTLQEIRVAWTAYAGAPQQMLRPADATPLNVFDLQERRRVTGVLPRERNPELSTDRLVIVGAGADGRPLFWFIAPDARVVRAEYQGPDGVLRGEVMHRSNPELRLTFPDAASLTVVRVYEPQWNGERWTLALLGSVDLGTLR